MSRKKRRKQNCRRDETIKMRSVERRTGETDEKSRKNAGEDPGVVSCRRGANGVKFR